MKYQANPVTVSAYRILSVATATDRADKGRHIVCEGLHDFWATPEMLARIEPKPADYVVVQEDGYTYLNPKDVFERKYSSVSEGDSYRATDPATTHMQITLVSGRHQYGVDLLIPVPEMAVLPPRHLAIRYAEPALAALQNKFRQG